MIKTTPYAGISEYHKILNSSVKILMCGQSAGNRKGSSETLRVAPYIKDEDKVRSSWRHEANSNKATVPGPSVVNEKFAQYMSNYVS